MQTVLALLFSLLPSIPAMSDELVEGVLPLRDAVIVQVAGGGCVDGPGLVQQVEARAGPGSVVDAGPRIVDVVFAGAAPEVFVGVTLEVGGQQAGGRRLGPFADCAAAVDAAALAIALVIDPFAVPVTPGPAPGPAPAVTTTPVATTPVTTTVEIVRPEPTTTPFQIGLGAAVGVGTGFGVAPGPVGLVRLRLDAGVVPIVVGLGGRVDVPGALVVDGTRRLESVGAAFFAEVCHRGSVSSSLVIDTCVVAQAGALRAVPVGFDNPQPTTARLVGAGGALTVRTPLGAGLGVFARLVVDTPVVRARLVADGGPIWESPPVTGLLAVGLDGLGGP